MFTLHHSRCLPLETLCKYQQTSETKICHTLHTGGDLPKKAMQKIISSHFQLIAAPLTFSSHTAVSNHRNDQAATLKVSNVHLVHFLLAHKFTHRLPLSRITLSHWSARAYIRRNFNDLISCWTSSFTCYFSDLLTLHGSFRTFFQPWQSRHGFYVPTLLYFWHATRHIAGQWSTSSRNRGCLPSISVMSQSSLN